MLKRLKSHLPSIVRSALVLGYPLVLFVIIGALVIPLKADYYKELGALFLFTSISIGAVLLMESPRLKKGAFLLLLGILGFFASIKLIFYAVFGVKISASSLFVLFETNKNEASEFLAGYVNVEVVVISLLFLIPILIASAYLVFKNKAISVFKLHYISTGFRSTILVLMLLCVYFLNRTFKDHSLVFTVSKSYKEYAEAKKNVQSDLAQTTSENISITRQDTLPTIGVVIIGEATSRWHMELYGYNRPTNPLLKEIKDELFIFEDAISPHVMTIRSLEKNLTLNSFETPQHETNFSVVQLANAAGFTTHWISNQEPVGFTESIPTIIGSAAQQTQFLATDSYNYAIYDENVLPELKKALQRPGERKLIFLHLIGTHRLYKKRYPETFNYFSGVNERTKFKTDYSELKVNEYDNAVRYNDYVVREIIETVRTADQPSFVVYFSDHGDEVFDTIDFIGHHGSKATRPMHDVPFITWFSEAYKKRHPQHIEATSRNTSKPYALEDFTHSFSDLIQVSAKGFDSTKSIFSSDFKVKRRQLRHGRFYDEL